MMYIKDFNELPNLVDANLNLNSIAETLALGPQHELVTALTDYNRQFSTSLAVTKRFHFKPGAYKDVKNAYNNYVLRWDMKPSGMERLFNRMEDWNWRKDSFKNNLIHIESIMRNLRRSGMVWQDNSDDLANEWIRLQDHVREELKIVNALLPNLNLEIKIGITTSAFDGYRHRSRMITPIGNESSMNMSHKLLMICKYEIDNATMMVTSVPGGQNYTSEGTKLVEDILPMPKVIVSCTADLLSLISKAWKKPYSHTARHRNRSVGFSGICISNDGTLRHPYLGTETSKFQWDLWMNDDNRHLTLGGNTCRGNMDDDIANSLCNFQISAHCLQIYNWLTNYFIPQTGPINNIGHMYHGLPDISSELKYASQSRTYHRNIADCHYPHELRKTLDKHAQSPGRTGSSGFNDDIHHEAYQAILESISVDDLECNNCSFKDECYKFSYLQMAFSREALDPIEEQILGTIDDIYPYLNGTDYSVLNIADSLKDHYLRLWQVYHEKQEDLPTKWVLAYELLRSRNIEHFEENDVSWNADSIARDDECVDQLNHYLYYRSFEEVVRESLRRLGKLMTEEIIGGSCAEYVAISKEEYDSKTILTVNEIYPVETVDLPIDPNDTDALSDLQTITPEEATIRWATRMGGGTQNM